MWGCKSWNLTRENLDKLCSFHHCAIHYILSIKWQDVSDKHIKNSEVCVLLYNILNIDALINQKTANYTSGKSLGLVRLPIPRNS